MFERPLCRALLRSGQFRRGVVLRQSRRYSTSWTLLLLVTAVLCCSTPSAYAANRRSSSQQTRQPRKATDPDDYYKLLGLSKTAKPKEIKKAYRKLALQFHPDKVPEAEKEEAENMFVRVSEAYAVLSDDEKRNVYDKYGKQGLEAMERGQDPAAAGFGAGGNGGFGGSGGGFGGGGGQQFHFSSGGGGFDPFSMFEEMFGDQGGFGGGGGGFQGNFGSSGSNRGGTPVDLFPKDQSHVSKLGSPKFPNAKSKNLWLIMFYRNEVQACQQAKPQMERLAEKAKGTFKVGAVDCGKNAQETHFCAQHSVKHSDVPKYVFVVDGKLEFYEEPGAPTAKDLYEFAMENMPKGLIKNINHPKQVAERLLDPLGNASSSNKRIASILLLTEKYETSALYYSIAYMHRGQFLFGESRAKNLNLSKAFGAKKYPLLLALVPKGNGDESYNEAFDVIRYDGSLKNDPISSWLNQVSKRLKSKPSSSSERRKQRAEYGL